MAEPSPEKQIYEGKIVERFGSQHQLQLVLLPPPASAPSEMKEAAN
jgi:hypothetical protein